MKNLIIMKNLKIYSLVFLFVGVFLILNPSVSGAALNWLKITVVDGNGNRVKNAEVRLYDNKKDYKKSKNPIEGVRKTDEEGLISYRNLDPDSTYYIEVEKGDLNNYMGGEKIKDLKKFGVNKITVVIQ